LEHLLKTYRNRLTNISSGNKSLLHLRISKENDIDFKEFDFLNNESVIKLLEKVLKGNKINLCAKNDSRNEKSNEVSVSLNKLFRKEKFIAEERGTNDLFIGFPYVEGKFNNGSVCRCPLLYFPVHLQLSSNNQWELVCTEDFFINKSFLLAYSHYNDIKFTDDFIENSLEEINTADFVQFLTSLYSYIKESPLELNFNRELFEQHLQFFSDYKKAALEEKYTIGELKLVPNAVLGIFPKTDSYLTPDYDELLKNNEFESLEHLLEERSKSDLSIIREENICTAYPIDASQEKTLVEIKKGKSVVVQGPPGSGKSQLICNLICDFTSKGKKVLVVSQKRAALDVVETRLKEKNVDNFVVNVHDFRNNRKALYAKLETQIESVENYKKQNSTLNAIELERNFSIISRKIESLTNELETFKNALFSESTYGVSIKELYLNTQKSKAFSSEIANQFNKTSLDAFLKKLETLVFYLNQIPENNFKDRKNLAHVAKEEIQFLEKYAQLIKTFSKIHFSDIITDASPQLVNDFLSIENTLIEINNKFLDNNKIAHEVLKKDFSENEIKKIFSKIEDFLSADIELELATEQVQLLEKITTDYLEIEPNTLKKWWWNISSSNKKQLLTYVEKINTEVVNKASKRLKKRILFDEYKTKLAALGLDFYSEKMTSEHFRVLEKQYLGFIQLKDEIKNQFLNHKQLLNNPEIWERLIHQIAKYKKIAAEALRFYSKNQLENLLTDNFDATDYQKWVSENYDLIIESDKILFSFDTKEANLFEQISNSNTNKNEWVLDTEKGVKNAWIDDLEAKNDVLKIVSTGKITLLEKELQELILQKNKLSTEIWHIRLRENTYKELKHNRLMNTVTYRDLKHQVAKKRSVWPIRKLVANFSEEVFNLTPCWLASPETVSAVFPLLPLFDLVIFDEASQCFAEKGIPAIYRGKQVVVAGDSKQLQPSDLYQIRWEQEEDEAILEIDSLLELCRQFLPEFTLTGHYRSSSFDLIAFSNKHFYKNQLQLIPHIDTLNNYQPAIHYIKVDGIWKSNTNETEAFHVVQLAFKLLAEGKKNFGIVTFNVHQQQLIQDLLDKHTGEFSLPDEVFVKNIENIQGDERDIIIFSVGYAPDSGGRFSAQFGSLNQQNGENRLNVAITRARHKIYIVSSIFPSQLEVDNTVNEGPKYFKKYLEYALQISNNEIKTVEDFIWTENELISSVSLAEKLKNNELKTIIPFADLVLRKQFTFENLFFTDDNRLFQSSTKEFFAYLPLSVTNMGWKYERLFSKNYFQKPL
jgi:superfamily I DNA and/or RNA helicase/KaiC/GvpD/RAD55 family RecA-like ATPase